MSKRKCAVLMMISRKNTNLVNWTGYVEREQNWYAKIVMSIFLLLMETEVSSTELETLGCWKHMA